MVFGPPGIRNLISPNHDFHGNAMSGFVPRLSEIFLLRKISEIGGFNIFYFSSRSLGKWSNLTIICFRWVGEKPPTSWRWTWEFSSNLTHLCFNSDGFDAGDVSSSKGNQFLVALNGFPSHFDYLSIPWSWVKWQLKYWQSTH